MPFNAEIHDSIDMCPDRVWARCIQDAKLHHEGMDVERFEKDESATPQQAFDRYYAVSAWYSAHRSCCFQCESHDRMSGGGCYGDPPCQIGPQMRRVIVVLHQRYLRAIGFTDQDLSEQKAQERQGQINFLLWRIEADTRTLAKAQATVGDCQDTPYDED